MPNAISNTSPLLYLHRMEGLDLLKRLFSEVYVPEAVIFELACGFPKKFANVF
jgi:predicted nucleic acid-binding protein